MNDKLPINEEDLKLREQLQRAVRSDVLPPYLETRIRANIRAAHRPALWSGKWAAAAATLLICFGAGVAYQLGHLRLTSTSQNAYISSVSNRVATIMRVGLGDHIHCSVFRKYPRNAPKVQELTEKMNPEYRGLIPVVQEHVPANFELMTAHQCKYRGRKFTHMAWRNDSGLLSLVIADKQDGESFRTEELLPALTQSGLPVYSSGVQRFQIAAFESRDHLVYVVSDMSRQKNIETILAIAPKVKDFLSKIEL